MEYDILCWRAVQKQTVAPQTNGAGIRATFSAVCAKRDSMKLAGIELLGYFMHTFPQQYLVDAMRVCARRLGTNPTRSQMNIVQNVHKQFSKHEHAQAK